MGTRKSTVARILTLACAGLFCLGASFTWTGNANGDWWDDSSNWDVFGGSGFFLFPNSANDDVLIPENGQVEWQIALATSSGQTELDVTIDDLTINENVEFIDDLESSPKLTCDTLVIHATGLGDTITVEMGAQDAMLVTQ